jgi:acyl-CoA reductase-like NAD-dependent aldehyde dehydrogenase
MLVKELIASQRNNFLKGHTRPISERKKNLRKLHDLLIKNKSLLAEAIYKDLRNLWH